MTLLSDKALSRMSVAASISLVLMVGGTAGYVAWPRLAGILGVKAATPVSQPAYAAGEPFDTPAEWYNSSRATLVVFARATCAACDKAQPFLKSLVTRLEGRADVVMAHPSGAEMLDAAFAQNIGIRENHLRLVTADLRVRATPTLVLVNQQGLILAAWEGVGSPDRQAEIVNTIEAVLK